MSLSRSSADDFDGAFAGLDRVAQTTTPHAAWVSRLALETLADEVP
ncbi:MAG: hypothetical protein L6Q99_21770 [Planctomycetes bacterium]|nr:hypothetical protein [Planctomycetota bacterium]